MIVFGNIPSKNSAIVPIDNKDISLKPSKRIESPDLLPAKNEIARKPPARYKREPKRRKRGAELSILAMFSYIESLSEKFPNNGRPDMAKIAVAIARDENGSF